MIWPFYCHISSSTVTKRSWKLLSCKKETKSRTWMSKLKKLIFYNFAMSCHIQVRVLSINSWNNGRQPKPKAVFPMGKNFVYPMAHSICFISYGSYELYQMTPSIMSHDFYWDCVYLVIMNSWNLWGKFTCDILNTVQFDQWTVYYLITVIIPYYIKPISYVSNHMTHSIWPLSNGPYHMFHIIWSIWTLSDDP